MTQTEPASPGVRVLPLTVHVLLVPGTTLHVTAPVPDPPVRANDNVSPYATDVEVTVNADWVALDTVITKPADSTGR